MKSRLSLLVFVAALGAAAPAYADEPAAPKADASPTAARDRFAGTFGFVGGDKQREALNAAIEKATDSMFFATRGIARSRLRDKTQIRAVVGFSFGGGNITSTASDITPAVSPESGAFGQYKSGSDTLKLSQKITGEGHLLQSFIAEDGSRTSTFVLSPDGKTLTVHIVLKSSKLPEPVQYTLTYQRK